MRKIEQQLNRAIYRRAPFKLANTRLEWDDDGGRVYLHGHRIATISSDTGEITPDARTFYNWPTMTTASRLRALGVNATIKKGSACLDGQPISPLTFQQAT